MIWGPRPKLRIAPPMGREIPTIHILAYNFWTVSQKIKISVSMDSLCRAESEDVNYARIDWTPCRPFWNVSYIFISSEPFDISSQKSVGSSTSCPGRTTEVWRTAPPTVREILRSLKKCITFKIFVSNLYFWCHFVPWVMLILKMSRLSFSKQRLSAVWSKWTTVFSLLLLENLSNSSQNCLRWSLDWAEQNLPKLIFCIDFVQKLWCCECQRLTQNWIGGCNLGQTWSIETKLGMLHQSPDLRVNTKVGNSATYRYWDRKMSHILLITLVWFISDGHYL